MVRIDFKDLKKAMALLEKESVQGVISFTIDGIKLKIGTADKTGRDMVIELSDIQYPFQPKITKTEIF